VLFICTANIKWWVVLVRMFLGARNFLGRPTFLGLGLALAALALVGLAPGLVLVDLALARGVRGLVFVGDLVLVGGLVAERDVVVRALVLVGRVLGPVGKGHLVVAGALLVGILAVVGALLGVDGP